MSALLFCQIFNNFFESMNVDLKERLILDTSLKNIFTLPGVCWYPCDAQDQFCTTQGVRVGHKGGVVVKRTPVRPNSDSGEFHAWVVLNYSSYVVLE